MNLSENEITWIYSATVDKLKEQFESNQLSDVEYESEMLRVKIWADKSYRDLEIKTPANYTDSVDFE